jgi:hypothetical protein
MTGPGTDGVLLINGAHYGARARGDMTPLLELRYFAVSLPGREGPASPPASLGSLTRGDLIASAAAGVDSTSHCNSGR